MKTPRTSPEDRDRAFYLLEASKIHKKYCKDEHCWFCLSAQEADRFAAEQKKLREKARKALRETEGKVTHPTED